MVGTARTCSYRPRALAALTALLGGLLLVLGGGGAHAEDEPPAPGRPVVAVTTVDGVISPVVDDHLAASVEASAAAGHDALVVLLDTPGGLVSSMREIVKTFLDAPVPVIVYVSPTGADAGSAGTFITYAAHVAAMAPATTIGAATPVSLEGGEVDGKVVENAAAFAEAIAEARDRDVDFAIESVREGRSVTADTALELGAVDLIAASLEVLLREVDGREVEVGDTTIVLRTADAVIVEAEMTTTQRILQTLADPNLAFLFLSLGTLAILYEIASPGLGFGGVIGGVSLVLAMFSLSVLPVTFAGAALLVLAAAMFVAELFMPGIGVGAAGGAVALLLGGLLLFPGPSGIGVDWWVLAPTAGTMLGLSVVAGVLVARSRRPTSRAGADELIGTEVDVVLSPGGRPRARIGSTLWRLLPAGGQAPLHEGERVVIIDRQNIDLIVARDPASAHPTAAEESR